MGIEARVVSTAKPFEGARDAFENLVADVSSESALSLSHSELEGMLHERGIELMRQVLQGHIDLRGPGQALAPVETADGVVLTHERWARGRQWESIFGTVSLQRVGYGAKEEPMAYPLDADLNLPTERYSFGVRRRVAKEVIRGSFDAAVVGHPFGAGLELLVEEHLKAEFYILRGHRAAILPHGLGMQIEGEGFPVGRNFPALGEQRDMIQGFKISRSQGLVNIIQHPAAVKIRRVYRMQRMRLHFVMLPAQPLAPGLGIASHVGFHRSSGGEPGDDGPAEYPGAESHSTLCLILPCEFRRNGRAAAECASPKSSVRED